MTDYAGKTFVLNGRASDPIQNAVVPGALYRVEGRWKEITGKSWMTSDGNFAAMHYGMRNGMTNLPIDDEVVYGKIGSLGHIVHISELGEEV